MDKTQISWFASLMSFATIPTCLLGGFLGQYPLITIRSDHYTLSNHRRVSGSPDDLLPDQPPLPHRVPLHLLGPGRLPPLLWSSPPGPGSGPRISSCWSLRVRGHHPGMEDDIWQWPQHILHGGYGHYFYHGQGKQFNYFLFLKMYFLVQVSVMEIIGRLLLYVPHSEHHLPVLHP